MSWDYKPITIKERLGQLENELDELIGLQEVARNKSRSIDNKDTIAQKCECVNVSSRTHKQGNNHLPCSFNKSTTEPLSDISKFLQHINLNISKGTQAITKIVNLTTHHKSDVETNSKLYHTKCFKKTNLPTPDNHTLFTTPSNEDNLFKEIREEKEKRQRAENQVKSLKQEIKISRADLQKNSDSILLLQSELKETHDKLEEANIQLRKSYQDQQVSESLWPYRYQVLSKELEDEHVRRAEAERKVQTLQDKLRKEFDYKEKNVKIQSNVNWLSIQNQHLTCLVGKLQNDIENNKCELLNKNQLLEENFRKTKQLTSVCEKLRDYLIATKEKVADGEERLRSNLTHCEKLTKTLLQEQENIEELKRRQIKDREEQERLQQAVKTANDSNRALQARINENSEIIRHQKDIIDSQSEKLITKEDQLKLAFENIKLHSDRGLELETRIKSLSSEVMQSQQLILNNDVSKINLELENEREKVLIKEKIIESHLETTIKLKSILAEKENDIHQLKIEISEKDRKITIEKNTNDHLLSKIKSLQCCKQEMEQKIQDLEEELETQESSEQAKRLDIIEKQIFEKQKKLEEHNLMIKKEKDEIIETLKDTNKKLENTIAELKEDLKTQEENIKRLNSQLRDKDNQLREAFERILKLSHELEEATEHAKKIENSYQGKLKNVCDAWKDTMQMLQS